MDNQNLRVGDVFKANRNDIVDEHEKYQLYFADDLILLINTDKNKINTMNVEITPDDCDILDHKSHICLDHVFKYLEEYKILKISKLSERALRKLEIKIGMSVTIPQYKIDRIRELIAKHLKSRICK